MNEATEAKIKKSHTGLKIFFIIIAALIAFAGIVYFGVYRDVYMYLTAELGEGAPDASCFIKSGGEASYKSAPDVSLTEEGRYVLSVKTADGYARKVLLLVEDTKAPQAEAIEKVITVDEKSMEPKDAVGPIYDASEYTAEWVKQPVFGTAGSYDCSVLLRDVHGNEQVIKSVVKVIGLKELVEYEAGTERPTLEDFMVVERNDAELLTSFSDINWSSLGDNTIEISFDGETYTSILRIVDTASPVIDTIAAAVTKDEEVGAGSFVLGCTDATEVSYELSAKPDTSKTGRTECSIKAIDAAGNSVEKKTVLYVCDDVVTFEASPEQITEAGIKKLLDTSKYASYKMQTEAFALDSLGAHEVVFENVSGETLIVGVVVKDTVAPTAAGITLECSIGYPCDALSFLDKISDASSVRASFVVTPDWTKEGEQDVEVMLTDRAGNSTTVIAKALLSADKTAPVLYAPSDVVAYAGEKPDYESFVYVSDNADPEPALTVNSTKVDTTKAGEYELVYTAKDHEGNSASATVKLTLIEKTVSDEKLNAEIDKVTKAIFSDGMTDTEKARAIFDYVYAMELTGSSDGRDMMSAAYSALTEKKGDSYSAYCVSYYLLSELDCRVFGVVNQSGTKHYWCLVDLGYGLYNFDACSSAPNGYKCFMKTSSELANVNSQYWSYNAKTYPPTETVYRF